MPDPEVKESVAALVAAFAEALTALEARYTDLTKVHSQRMALRQLGPAIESSYQNKLQDIGPQFAIGDDICRRELRSCLEDFQANITAPLKGQKKYHLYEISPSAYHRRAKKALEAQRDRMVKGQQSQASSAQPGSSLPGPTPEISRSSTESSEAGASGNASGGAPAEGTGKTASRFSRLVSPSIKWGEGWGRTRRVQQYCPAALWQQGAGVAKQGVGPGLVGCPDCKWGHQDYPPDLIQLEYGEPKADTIWYVFSVGKRRDETHWKLPHRFFAKSHLHIPDGMVLSQNSLRGHQVFGCILCDKKKKVKDFDDARTYARHVKEEHTVKEFEKELDVLWINGKEYSRENLRHTV